MMVTRGASGKGIDDRPSEGVFLMRDRKVVIIIKGDAVNQYCWCCRSERSFPECPSRSAVGRFEDGDTGLIDEIV